MEDCYKAWCFLFDKPCFMEEHDKEKSEVELKKYKKCCLLCKGAILFCVHRAKFTEGHNFSGDLCNGIIMVGEPNLNIKSPKI